MSAYLIWLIITIVLLAVEMMIGSIFILACVLGSAGGCIAAVLGGGVALQALTAAVITIVGVIVVASLNKRKKNKFESEIVDNDLDLGKDVMVSELNPDGSATVDYRGTKWKAYPKEGTLEPGHYRISKVDGARLILEK